MDNKQEYMVSLRKRILKDLEDLKEKITTNEKLPEKEQDVDFIISISDKIEECLNNWYY